jgi:hypothetical protein
MATKKDYEAIAAILRREHEKLVTGVIREPHLALTILTNKIMGYFQSDSDRFDWDRFAKAARYHPDTPPPDAPGCYCTECYRQVDEKTFDELEGMCEVCDGLHTV